MIKEGKPIEIIFPGYSDVHYVNNKHLQPLDKLPLDSDIYSYTFFKCATKAHPHQIRDLMKKCLATASVQCILAMIKLNAVSDKPVYRGDVLINVVRLVCVYIMHIQLFPACREAVTMIQYSLYNDHKFVQKSIFFPLVISHIKIFSSLVVEFGNLYMVIRYTDV